MYDPALAGREKVLGLEHMSTRRAVVKDLAVHWCDNELSSIQS
jgi:hypothetical protein